MASNPLIQSTGLPHWLLPKKRYHGPPYTEQTWHEILTRMAGGEYLVHICRPAHMPDHKEVLRWIRKKGNERYWNEYMEARIQQSEILGEKTLMIADGVDENGEEVLEDVERSKLRIATIKFVIGRYDPERWGEKRQETTVGINITEAMDKARLRAGLVVDQDGKPVPQDCSDLTMLNVNVNVPGNPHRLDELEID